jgi:hypothetical protein
MNINEYIAANRNGKHGRLCKPVTCQSGLTMSVQASSTHYCEPRNDEGPYESVEVGFPNRKVEALMEFAETPENPTETVYGHVPVALIEKVILENGGLVNA